MVKMLRYLLNFGRRNWKLMLLCIYVTFTSISLKQSSLPSRPCPDHDSQSHNNCAYPLVLSGDTLSMELWLFQKKQKTQEPNNHTTTTNSNKRARWVQIESCKIEFTIPKTSTMLPSMPTYITNDNNCTFTLPSESRIRWSDRDKTKGGPLKGKLRLRKMMSEKDDSTGPIVIEIPIEMTRIIDRKHEHVPYTKYSLQPLLIRFVVEDRAYHRPYYRNDGFALKLYNRSTYRPIMYVDDNALRYSSSIQMAPPGKEAQNKPPLNIKIQFSCVSPLRDVIIRQLTQILNGAQSVLGKHEMDELRYWLRDERLYRFCLTQIISVIHLWLDYMAFKDEIMFYRKKSSFGGVSVSSVVSRLVCRSIILLYLVDGGGVSWIVLIGIFSEILVQTWKLFKLLRPTIVFDNKCPFVAVRCKGQSKAVQLEKDTAEYDKTAMFYLQAVLYPIVVGWSVYSMVYKTYKSWYSWMINCLVDVVYAFGFVSLCPQLYINYKLKSVSHLPIKVFLYKLFNTFVDDVFALLVDMPIKHKLMTLRDDVVFVVLLYQWYLYRVDKSRTNEYGYSYDEDDEKDHDSDGDRKQEENSVINSITKDKDV